MNDLTFNNRPVHSLAATSYESLMFVEEDPRLEVIGEWQGFTVLAFKDEIDPRSFPGNPMTVAEFADADRPLASLAAFLASKSEASKEADVADSAAGDITPDSEFSDSITGSKFF